MATETNPYDMSLDENWEETKKNAQAYLSGLQSQADAAQKAVGAVDENEGRALSAVREQSGRVFAQQQARGGGGSLAGMRQSALSRGVAEGATLSDYAKQRLAAQQLAAGAQTELASEKQKFLKEIQGRTDAVLAKAKSDAAAWIENNGGMIMTDNDYNQLAQVIREQGYKVADPEQKKALYAYADQIQHQQNI